MPMCLLLVAATCLPPVQTAFMHFPKLSVLLMHEQGRYKDPRGAALSQGLFLPAVGVTFKASDTGKAVTMTVLLLP